MTSKPPTVEKELAFVEKCIVKTMRRFRETPGSFWSEEDVCCYLKGLLLKGKLLKKGRLGNVFLGYSTKNTYLGREDGALVSSRDGKSVRFAIAGWTSVIPTTRNHLTQQLSFAINLKHFRSIPDDWVIQIRNDLLKLSDEANQVPANGRFFLLLTTQPTSQLRGQLNELFLEFPTVRIYQQFAQ